MYNNILDIFHNVYGIVFCFQMLYFSIPILLSGPYESEIMTINYNNIFIYSSAYFFISGVIHFLDGSYLFLLHHILSWIGIYYGYDYKEPKIIYFLCQNLLSEISTIVWSFDIIIKKFSKIYNFKYNFEIQMKFIFAIIYTIVRIIYLVPININFVQRHEFIGFYKYILFYGLCFMICLNIYWFMLLIKKILKFINSKNNNVKNE